MRSMNNLVFLTGRVKNRNRKCRPVWRLGGRQSRQMRDGKYLASAQYCAQCSSKLNITLNLDVVLNGNLSERWEGENKLNNDKKD